MCVCLFYPLQIQTLDIPGEVKAGYSPIGFVRCGRSACKITKIDWKVRVDVTRGGLMHGSVRKVRVVAVEGGPFKLLLI